jgi:hypothetical protein
LRTIVRKRFIQQHPHMYGHVLMFCGKPMVRMQIHQKPKI